MLKTMQRLLFGSNNLQMCKRCGNQIFSDTPRDVIEGKVYHVYCGWKILKEKEWKMTEVNPSSNQL
jgi:hypothetical protein